MKQEETKEGQVRINISLHPGALKVLDDYAADMGITRSALIGMLAQGLKTFKKTDLSKALGDVVKTMLKELQKELQKVSKKEK